MRIITIVILIFLTCNSYGQSTHVVLDSLDGIKNNFPGRKNGFYKTLNDYVENEISYSPIFELKIGSAKLHRIEFPKKSKPTEGQVYRNTACVVLNDTLYIKSRKYKKSYMKVIIFGKLSLVPYNPAGDVWVPVFFTPWAYVEGKVNHSSSFGTLFNLENGHYLNFTPINFRKFLLKNDKELYNRFKKIKKPTFKIMLPFLLEYNQKHQHIFK